MEQTSPQVIIPLFEKNRIYQQRYKAKKRAELGDDEYRKLRAEEMKKYREDRNRREGYVKPIPVVRIIEPSRPPIKSKKDIIVKPIDRKKKQTSKQVDRIKLLKLKLKNTQLGDRSIKDYINKHVIMYKMFTGDIESQTMGGWKEEALKALRNQNYDEGLHEVLYYFREIQQVVQALREKFPQSDNSLKGYTVAISALLGRLETFDEEYQYVSNIGIQLNKLYLDGRDLNELPEAELAKINKILFDDDSIANNIKLLPSLRDKALYAIYMYIPRRLEVASTRIKFLTNDSNYNLKDGNYLVLNDSIPDKFVFNDYKTDRAYQRQTVDVPEQIKPILHEYILQENFQNNDFLFHLKRTKDEEEDRARFSNTFTEVFSSVYGEKVTNQDLRIAYATYWLKRARNVTDKRKISNALSHKLETNEQYNKVNVKEN